MVRCAGRQVRRGGFDHSPVISPRHVCYLRCQFTQALCRLCKVLEGHFSVLCFLQMSWKVYCHVRVAALLEPSPLSLPSLRHNDHKQASCNTRKLVEGHLSSSQAFLIGCQSR
ncbi:uncharacterized protein LOC135113626 [Scylla paramamosain]|uniref:uncharacterized protein LOC135113626 n=1 Tax=Scylla paramamosain TaxID=85552 RepID=UPI0030838FB8